MSEIKYEILQNIGVLSKSASGWAKELNLISWNDREPKYDLRDWSADHQKMGKGVTLSKEELLTERVAEQQHRPVTQLPHSIKILLMGQFHPLSFLIHPLSHACIIRPSYSMDKQ